MLDHKTVQFSFFTKVGCHNLFNRRIGYRCVCTMQDSRSPLCRFLGILKYGKTGKTARHSNIGPQVLLLFPSCPDRPEEAGAHVERARRIARTGLGGRCASLQSAKCKTMINTDVYFVSLYVHHWHPKPDSPFSHWQFPEKGACSESTLHNLLVRRMASPEIPAVAIGERLLQNEWAVWASQSPPYHALFSPRCPSGEINQQCRTQVQPYL
jgi:hypothetical protein